jgi:hypothetical protein
MMVEVLSLPCRGTPPLVPYLACVQCMYPCPTAHADQPPRLSLTKTMYLLHTCPAQNLPAPISYHSFFTAIAAKYQQVWYGCTHVLELPTQGFPHHARVSLHNTFTVASLSQVESTTTSRSMQGPGPCQISRGSTTVL